MSERTKIEWADSSLNLMAGCDGCELWNAAAGVRHCYAGELTERYGGRKGWPERFEEPKLFIERLDKALRWKDLTGTERPTKPWMNGLPRLIFLNDMGDTFTESLAVDWMAPLVERMAASPHVFMLLTKRPKRAEEFGRLIGGYPANFWVGTSVTKEANVYRVQDLLDVDAAVRFVSAEPLLGAASLHRAFYVGDEGGHEYVGSKRQMISWVIVGCESGHRRRPMEAEWPLNLRRECDSAGVAFFTKQMEFNGRVVHDMELFPPELRVREFPAAVAAR